MKNILFLITIIMGCTSNHKKTVNLGNPNPFQDSVPTLKGHDDTLETVLKKDLEGNWIYEVKDSICFTVTVQYFKDTLLLDYTNVMKKGNILNASQSTLDTPDYALSLSVPENISLPIYAEVKNYWDDSLHLLKLSFEKKHKRLHWQIFSSENLPEHLPMDILLSKDSSLR